MAVRKALAVTAVAALALGGPPAQAEPLVSGFNDGERGFVARTSGVGWSADTGDTGDNGICALLNVDPPVEPKKVSGVGWSVSPTMPRSPYDFACEIVEQVDGNTRVHVFDGFPVASGVTAVDGFVTISGTVTAICAVFSETQRDCWPSA